METLRKFKIEKLAFPVDGFHYNVSVWISVDSGETFAYCGIGKFCKTRKECKRYIADYKREIKG